MPVDRKLITHQVTVYYPTGSQVFRGTLGYCREIRAGAIDDRTAVSGIIEIAPEPSEPSDNVVLVKDPNGVPYGFGPYPDDQIERAWNVLDQGLPEGWTIEPLTLDDPQEFLDHMKDVAEPGSDG